MLTRVEIDGFKSFEGFALDLQPFTVVFGGNATGKSNLFDALRLLSRVVSTDLATAFAGGEGDAKSMELRGEPIEQFRRLPDGRISDHITLAVEVLLPPRVRDAWGAEMVLRHTRIRYRVRIERRKETSGRERLFVAHEEALPILRREDRWEPGGSEPSRAFRQATLHYGRRGSPFLSTGGDDRPEIIIHQDEAQRGRPRPAGSLEATVLSSITTSSEFPHLYALREVLRSIHFLQLDPSSLRQPSPAMGPELLRQDGRNLASVLARIKDDTRTDEHPRGMLEDIVLDLKLLVPSVKDLHVVHEESERRYRIEVELRDGLRLTSRVVSDGTLRLLALVTMLHDPLRRGIVCFEEPENGVSKAYVRELMSLLRSACTDPHADEVDHLEPHLQMVLNTHSPVVAGALDNREIVVADTVQLIDPRTQQMTRATRMRRAPLTPQESLELGAGAFVLSQGELDRLADTSDAYAA
jgi:predicted ATPase